MKNWYKNASEGENRPPLFKAGQIGFGINPEFFERERLQKMRLGERDVMVLFHDMIGIEPDKAAATIGLTWPEILSSARKTIDGVTSSVGQASGLPPQMLQQLRGVKLGSELEAQNFVVKLIRMCLDLQSAPPEATAQLPLGFSERTRKMVYDVLGIGEGGLKRRFDDFAPMLAEEMPASESEIKEPMTEQQKSVARDFLLDQYKDGKITLRKLKERMKEFALFLAGLSKEAQSMQYPYYTAEAREGRFKGLYQPNIAMIPSLRRQWDEGRMGTGTRLHEFRSGDFGDLVRQLRQAGFDTRDAEFFAVRAPNSPKEKVRGDELFALLRQGMSEQHSKTAQAEPEEICWWCETNFDLESPLPGQERVVVKGEPMHAVCAREAARFTRLEAEQDRLMDPQQ